MAGRVTGRSLAATLVCAAWLALAGAHPSALQESPPELTRPVNDFAGVLDDSQEATLDRLIRTLQSASSDVLVVATVNTFKPAADIRTYANEMFENHGRGIGLKGRDNGLLLLLAVDDRQVWAEVGYDLEGIITDGFAGETSRDVMVPLFRRGDYGGGLIAGATRLAERIAQARNVSLDGSSTPVQPARDDDGDFPFLLVLFLVVVLVNAIGGTLRRLFGGRRRRRGRWTSGVGPFGAGYGGWSSHGTWRGGGGGFGGGFGGFGGGRSGGGGGGAGW
jgi:uncharacterized protein